MAKCPLRLHKQHLSFGQCDFEWPLILQKKHRKGELFLQLTQFSSDFTAATLEDSFWDKAIVF